MSDCRMRRIVIDNTIEERLINSDNNVEHHFLNKMLSWFLKFIYFHTNMNCYISKKGEHNMAKFEWSEATIRVAGIGKWKNQRVVN